MLFHFVNERKLPLRAVAVLVIAAILVPAIYFGGVRMASAHVALTVQQSAPVGASPERFMVPGSEFGVCWHLAAAVGLSF